jgi:hypothetical protein
MAEYTVGQASVLLVPSFKGFAESLDAQFAQYGDSAGSKFSDAFNARVDAETSDAIGDQDADAAIKGDSAGGKFADAFKARIDLALADLPDVHIDGDSTDLDRKLADVRLELLSLRNQTIGVDISDDEALAKLVVLKAALEDIGHTSESVSVKVNTGAAVSDLGNLSAAGLSGAGGAGSGVDALGTDAAESGGEITGILLPALAVLATALIPIGGLAAGALSTLPAVLAGAGSGFAAIELGTSGVSGAVSDLATALASPSLANVGAYFSALSGLAPSAQTFVGSLKPLIQGFDDLKLVTQQDLFSGLQGALPGIQSLFVTIEPFITQAATGIGQFVTYISTLLSSQTSLSEINTIFSAGAGFMKDLAKAAADVVPAFLTIGAQASPILSAIGKGIDSVVASFAKWVSNGGFEKFVDWLKDNGPGLVRSLEQFASGFGKILIATVPVGEAVLKIVGVFGEMIGALAPFEKYFVAFFTGGLPQVIAFFADNWRKIWTDIENTALTVWNFLNNDVFQPLENFFTVSVPHALSVFSGAVTQGFQTVHDTVNTIWAAMQRDFIDPIINFFTVTIPNAADGVGKALQAALSDVEGIIEAPFTAAWKVIDGIYNDIKSALNFIGGGSSDAPGTGSGGAVPNQPVAGRASGGPVLPGLSYIVGEQGREILSLGATGGYVTNAAMSAPIISGLTGGSNGPVMHSDVTNIASPVDAQILGSQLAFLRRAVRF